MKEPEKLGNLWWKAPDKEWLEHQYLVLEKSALRISRECGAAVGTVISWLKSAEISCRTRAEAQILKGNHLFGDKAPCWKGGHRFYGISVMRRARIPRKCAWCGDLENLHVHHRNHNEQDHSLENLQFLCRACHMFETALWQLLKQNKVRLVAEGNQMLIVWD